MTTILADRSTIRSITTRCLAVGWASTVCNVVTTGISKTRQEFDDVATGLTAENAVFMLERDDIKARSIQEFGCLAVVFYLFVVNLKAYRRRVVIRATRIGHCDYTGLKVGPGGRNRAVQVMGKRCDTAPAWQIIANEGDTLKELHLIAFGRPLLDGAFV